MEKVWIIIATSLFILLVATIIIAVHFWKITKNQLRLLDEKEKIIEEKNSENSELKDRVVQETLKNAELQKEKEQAEKNTELTIRLLENTEARLMQDIIALNKEVQEKEDYAHWVGTTALETDKAYNSLKFEKEQLEKKLQAYEQNV